MKKLVIFLMFAVALIYYGANNFVDSFLNGGNDKIAEETLMKTEPDSTAVESSSDDVFGKKTSPSSADAMTHSAEPLASEPLEPAIRDTVRELVDTSHEGLVEEQTEHGVALRLNGKFRTAPVATIDENGKLTVRDYTSPPEK